jgi:hypothetical protein
LARRRSGGERRTFPVSEVEPTCPRNVARAFHDPLQPSRSLALDNHEPDDFAHFPVSEEEAFPRLYRTATMNRRGNFSMSLPSERAG